jgi:hypothetical protein
LNNQIDRRAPLKLKGIFRKEKSLMVIAILVLLLEMGTFVWAALTSNVTIAFGGQISPYVTAASGSAADIQAAVNLLGGGGTVRIPAGTFYWNGETVTVPGGVNIIGASPAGCAGHTYNFTRNNAATILHNNFIPPGMPDMFHIDGRNGLSSRISGIQFEAAPPADDAHSSGGNAISTLYLKNFRIDHCSFINFCADVVFVDSNAGEIGSQCYSYGVLDHNYVDCPSKVGNLWVWGNGFYARGSFKPGLNNWDGNIAHFAGVYGAVPMTTIMYVEDNHFVRVSQSTDGIQGAWVVVRYNLFELGVYPWGDVDLHGSQEWYGARGMEVYNNTFVGTTGYLGVNPQDLGGIRIRGGSGLFFNNTVQYTQYSDMQCVICLDDYDVSASGDSYPITDLSQTYIWSNNPINCDLLNVRFGTQNVNYFLRAPAQAQDGFTYVPYQYPHPLTLNS